MSFASPLARRLSAAISLTALSLGAASAQSDANSAEAEDVIVITSSPISVTSDEVVGGVNVISETDLVRDLNGNLADTLERLPGVSTTYFGPASGRPVIRGLSEDRVRILINGLAGLDASSSSPDHAVSAEVLGARQVEVLRGPAAIAYGGGAIGGVVNVLDGRIPTERVDGLIDGYIYAGLTDVDEGTQLAGRLTADFNGLIFQIEGLSRQSESFEIPGFAETEALREEHHDDDHDEDHDDHDEDHDEHEEEEPAYGEVPDSDFTFETYSGAVSLVQDWGFVGIAVKDTEAEYGLPGHAHGHEDEHDEDHDDDHGDDHDDHDEDEHEHGEEEGARLVLDQTRVDIRGEVNRDGFFNRVRFSFALADYTHAELEGDEVGTLFDKEGFEGRIELAHNHNGPRRGAWGFQVLTQDFQASGEEAFIEPVTTQDWGLFVTERWDYDSWGFEGGLRVETRNLNGLRAERSFDTVSGSASVFARPNDAWFLAGTLSRTERAPTDTEVFAEGPHAATRTFERGDLNLDTETAWSGEFTARYSLDRFDAELNVFYADYDGFIELFPTGEEEDGMDVFVYRQADAELFGFEAAISADLATFANWDVRGEASLDYVQGDTDSGDLPRLPPLSSTLALIAEQGIWSVRGEARLVAEQDEVAQFETETEGYTLYNADLEVTPFTNHDVRVLIGVRNISDEEARVHSSFLKDQVPLPGRNVRIGVRAGF